MLLYNLARLCFFGNKIFFLTSWLKLHLLEDQYLGIRIIANFQIKIKKSVKITNAFK